MVWSFQGQQSWWEIGLGDGAGEWGCLTRIVDWDEEGECQVVWVKDYSEELQGGLFALPGMFAPVGQEPCIITDPPPGPES